MRIHINKLPPSFPDWIMLFRFLSHHLRESQGIGTPDLKFLITEPNPRSGIQNITGLLPRWDEEMYQISYDHLRAMVYKEMLLDALLMIERGHSIGGLRGIGATRFVTDVKNILVETGQKDIKF